MEEFSPFDVTKVYVYGGTGVILKSEEFYGRFGIEMQMKAN